MSPDSLVGMVLSAAPDTARDHLKRHAPQLTVRPGEDVTPDLDVLILVGDADWSAPSARAAHHDIPVVRVDPGDGQAAWQRAGRELAEIGSPRFWIRRHAAARPQSDHHRHRIEAEQRRLGAAGTDEAGPVWPEFAGDDPGGAGPILVNAMPLAPPVRFHDRLDKYNALVAGLTSPTTAVTVVLGKAGLGKTALLGELRLRLRRTGTPPTAAGFVYLGGGGHRRITAATVLADLARVVTDGETRRQLTAARPWPRMLDDLAKALDGVTVVLALDDCQELLDDDGEFAEPELGDFLVTLAGHAGHVFRVVIATKVMPQTLERRLAGRLHEVALDQGLPRTEAVQLLRDLDDGTLGLAAAGDADLGRVWTLTGGRPRWLELFASCLRRTRPGTDQPIEALCGTLSATRDPGSAMVGLLTAELDRTERRVLQALAAFGRPVEAEAVNQLLHDHVSGLTSGPILRDLTRRHLVRADGNRYYLVPEPDARLIRSGVPQLAAADPRQFTLTGLRLLAADYFASIRLPVREPDDLWPRFSEIELRLLGGDLGRAAEVMNELDEQHLERWGQSAALTRWRTTLIGQLGDPEQEAQNLWRLAKAHLQRDEPATAEQYARDALAPLARAGDERNALTVTIERANALQRNGDIAAALALYEEATHQAHRRGQAPTEAGALVNSAICLMEQGRAGEAEQRFAAAGELLDGVPVSALPALRVRLLLGYGWAAGLLGDHQDAERRIGAAVRIAEEIRDDHLLGACLDSLAFGRLYRPAPENALATAQRAAELGTKSGDRGLITRSYLTLALAHHFSGRPGEALRTILLVTGGRQDRSAQLLGALAVAGLIAFRAGDDTRARQSCVHASAMAHRLRPGALDHQVYDALGLALTGLVMLGDDDRGEDARAAFAEARRIAPLAGLIDRNRKLLGSFGPRARTAELAAIVAVATRG